MADDVNRDGEGSDVNSSTGSGGADDLFLFGEEEVGRPKREETEADLSDLEGSRAADDVTNPNIHLGIERADTISSDGARDATSIPAVDATGPATSGSDPAAGNLQGRGAQGSPLDGGLTAPGSSDGSNTSAGDGAASAATASPAPESLVEERPSVDRVAAGDLNTDFRQTELTEAASSAPIPGEQPTGSIPVGGTAPTGPAPNVAPEAIQLSNQSFGENAPGAVIGDLSAYDPNGSAGLTFAVDDPRFEVVDGQLKLRPGVSFNHEADPQVQVTITVTDDGGLSFEQTFNLTVGDVNEGPSDISLSNTSVAENAAGAIVGTLSTTDVDAGDAHTYAVDDARFEVVDGSLKLKEGVSLNHEAEASVDVTVTTTDAGGLTYTETFSIAVGDVNEGPSDISLSNSSVAENAA
ncbi:MAG: hypothetical protein RLN89_02475, partial [Parvibaculum sp.]